MVRFDDEYSTRDERRARHHDDAWMRKHDDAAEQRAAQHYAHISEQERARLQRRLARRVAVAAKRSRA